METDGSVPTVYEHHRKGMNLAEAAGVNRFDGSALRDRRAMRPRPPTPAFARSPMLGVYVREK